MATTPTVIEGTWEELLAMSPRFAGRRVRLTVVEELEAVVDPGEPTGIAKLQAKLAELGRAVPDDAWNALPADLTDRLDHYLANEDLP